MDSTNGSTKPITQHCDSQIYALNLTGPLERDLLYVTVVELESDTG